MKKELSSQIIIFVVQICLIIAAIFSLLIVEDLFSIVTSSLILCMSFMGLFINPSSFAKVFIKTYEISDDSQMYKKIRKTRFLTIFIFIYWFKMKKNRDNV